MFTYDHVKWFYGQSERAYYLNYFIIANDTGKLIECIIHCFLTALRNICVRNFMLPGLLHVHIEVLYIPY